MIGMFAVSKSSAISARSMSPGKWRRRKIGNVFRGMWTLTKRYPVQTLRGSCSARDRRAARRGRRHRGVDVLCDVEALLQEPEKFGTGHIEGFIEAGASNNSALAGA